VIVPEAIVSTWPAETIPGRSTQIAGPGWSRPRERRPPRCPSRLRRRGTRSQLRWPGRRRARGLRRASIVAKRCTFCVPPGQHCDQPKATRLIVWLGIPETARGCEIRKILCTVKRFSTSSAWTHRRSSGTSRPQSAVDAPMTFRAYLRGRAGSPTHRREVTVLIERR
jgi:hypothetical protein